MSLSDLASIGSFVSGVAALVSLVYHAIQVRQAEKNQRAVLNHGYMTRVADYLRGSPMLGPGAVISKVRKN